MGNILSVALLAVFLGLVAAVVGELRFGSVQDAEIQPPAVDGEPPAPVAAEAAFSLAAIDTLTETVERPLFTDTRRPPPPQEVVQDATPTPRTTAKRPSAQFQLSAIVIADGERVALLQHPRDGRIVRIAQGELLDGWSLDEVRDDEVVLRSGADSQTVALRQFTPPPPPKRAKRKTNQRTKQRTTRQTNRQKNRNVPQEAESELEAQLEAEIEKLEELRRERRAERTEE